MPPKQNNLGVRVRRFQQFDEDRIPDMLQTVEGFVRSRNTFTESEFAHFQPYYQKDTPSIIRQQLEKELGERTSPFEPIRIVADHGDAEGNHQVLIELPARLAPTTPINGKVHDTTKIVDTFSNKVENPNPLNTAAEEATDKLMVAVSKSIRDDNGRKRNAKVAVAAEHVIAEAKGKPFIEEEELSDPSELEDTKSEEESIDDFNFDSVKNDDEDEDLNFDDSDNASLEDMEMED